MITKSKQSWTLGATVNVGFLKLRVTGFEETPGDFAPDAYFLESLNGERRYRFVPHNGLERID